MKKINFVDLSKSQKQLEPEIMDAMKKVMSHGWYIMGPEKKQFEENFAKYCGVKHCIGVDNGMSALEVSLRALDVKQGDEVITVPNTYYSTVRAITKVGATPVLVDINKDTCNIDVNQVEKVITPRTKVILPVHLYGQPVDMLELNSIAESHGISILEDACQAHGAEYTVGDTKYKTGNLGHIAAFSFYPGKNLGCLGDGGAVTTNSDDLAEKVRLLHDHGQKIKYHHLVEGDNHRLDTLQAAVLDVKLKHLDEWNKMRQDAAERYNFELKGVEQIRLPVTSPGRTHVNHLYVVHTKDRNALQKHLADNGVTVGLHYPRPIHAQLAFAKLGYKPGDFPISEESAETLMSLPMYPGISDDEVSYVCDKIKEFYNGRSA